MPGLEQLEERPGAGFEVPGRVVGPFVGEAEDEAVELFEGRPLVPESSGPGQLAQLRRRLHRADPGEIQESQGLSRADELGPDHAEIVIQIVGDERRPGPPGLFQELVQHVGQAPAHPAGLRLRDAVDHRRVGGDRESLRPDDVAAQAFGGPHRIVTGPGDLDEMGPIVGAVDGKVPVPGQPRRLAIEE